MKTRTVLRQNSQLWGCRVKTSRMALTHRNKEVYEHTVSPVIRSPSRWLDLGLVLQKWHCFISTETQWVLTWLSTVSVGCTGKKHSITSNALESHLSFIRILHTATLISTKQSSKPSQCLCSHHYFLILKYLEYADLIFYWLFLHREYLFCRFRFLAGRRGRTLECFTKLESFKFKV